jgi:hypothetical protein
VSLRTITPNLWTVLQLRAPVERTSMGVPNPMWTGIPTQDKPEGTASRGALALHAFAVRANHPARRAALAAFNRTLDALGLGDSILVTIA